MNQSLSRFDHATQRFVLRELRPPANAFEWRRYTDEERARLTHQQSENRTCPTNTSHSRY